jgi:hypothetical protein
MPVQIVEILRRSEQGVTLPFICRGDDGHTYFVKGRGAGRHSLIAEYICGRLARSFGLPVADFEVAEVPEALIRASLLPDIADLGSGLVFGSRALQHVQELRHHQLKAVPAQTCKDVLVFDWWIRNQDRTLTTKGGNPNLLWDQTEKQLVVIDHNVAFEASFSPQLFAESHVFSAFIPKVFDDLAERANYEARLQQAFVEYDIACDNLPSEWWWVDEGVPALFDKLAVRSFLANVGHDKFWRIAP